MNDSNELPNIENLILKFPKKLQDRLDQQQSMSDAEKVEVVNILGKAILKVKARPKKAELETITGQFYLKYRGCFDKRISENCLLPGRAGLLRRMCNFRDNQTRDPVVKNLQLQKYGCTKKRKPTGAHGQLNPMPKAQKIEEPELEELKKLAFTVPTVEEIEIFQKAFPYQRQHINAYQSVEDIIAEWPVLKTTLGLREHFRLLMGFECVEKVSSSFETKSLPLFETLRGEKGAATPTFHEVDSFRETNPRAIIPGLIDVLMSYFKEEKGGVFQVQKVNLIVTLTF